MNFAAGGIEGELVLRIVLRVQGWEEDGGGEQQKGVAKEVSRGGEAEGTKGVGELSGVAGFAEGGEGGQIGCGLANYRVHELPQ